MSFLRNFIAVMLFALLPGLISCTKSSDGCPGTGSTNIVANRSVIYTGATLSLSTSVTNGTYTYQWSGPGGWTSASTIGVRTNMQNTDAGIYSVNIFDIKNCLIYSGSKNISVIPVPNPPCTISNNTITSGPPYNLNYSFPAGVSAYPYQSGYYYTVLAPGNERVDILFSGSHPPYAGIYTGDPLAFQQEDYFYITINTPTRQFRSKGGELYVNNIGGKMVVTMCSVTMYEFLVPNTDFILTGKLTPF